jgi:hypothetical protein
MSSNADRYSGRVLSGALRERFGRAIYAEETGDGEPVGGDQSRSRYLRSP